MASLFAPKNSVALLLVGEDEEAYPNSVIKVRGLHRCFEGRSRLYVVGVDWRSLGGFRKKYYTLLLCILKSFLTAIKIILGRHKVVYISYPGYFVAFFLCLCPRVFRPVLVLDYFLSIYDTVVVDRELVSSRFLQKIIKAFDRCLLLNARLAVVDTAENADYYAALFGVSPGKFIISNLAISSVKLVEPRCQAAPNERFQCLFVGTMVPLQGVQVIVEASRILSNLDQQVQFLVVGDGQDGHWLNDAPSNVSWRSSWANSLQLAEYMSEADLCLGIFGSGNKAARVWPLKNYMYMAAGKAFLTVDSPCARTILGEADVMGQYLVPAGDPEALAARILALKNNPKLVNSMEMASRRIYDTQMQNQHSISALYAELNKYLDS
ncbi:glycosyltransferase [Simiduia aestuariiviva]|uniref:Glycosyltransferase involved in cell wall biosynthesis n=1 Tax=Simiduia aestuariiviva TaxID=1510459 RepID=A0A839UMY8_9GAMM|nr:glycosyltransferase [Simiduia aestuariiviva]MBB3169083.1 glycosyltransferase involved in cell wall biosynthesis [Simiduia aestuariiviva]